jgi:hypothetical protein
VATLVAWFLDALPAMVAFMALTAVVALGTAAWRARRDGFRAALADTVPDGVLVIALGAIAILTLGDPMGSQPDRVNLIPFRDQWWALQGLIDPVLATATLVANVLLFVPLGAALAARHPDASGRRLVLLAALVSIGVEAAQAVMNVGRLADVTDVMANTGGAAIGVVLWGMLAGEGPNERSA